MEISGLSLMCHLLMMRIIYLSIDLCCPGALLRTAYFSFLANSFSAVVSQIAKRVF